MTLTEHTLRWGRGKYFAELDSRLRPRRRMRMLEFGCVRQHDAVEGDGHSTVFLQYLCQETGSRLFSVDISIENIRTCREILDKQGLQHPTFICTDALETAMQWAGPRLDLLYIDGCAEWPTEDVDAFHKAHFDTFVQMEPWLKKSAIVVVDDPIIRGIKLIPYMLQQGWYSVPPSNKHETMIMVREAYI